MRDEEAVSRTGGGVAWLAWWGLVLAAACGGDPGVSSDADSDDGGGDALLVAPGSFPADPKGGELAWVVSAPGTEDPASVAVDPQGNIFVVARQTGAVSLGSVHVPQPTSGNGLLVLKLSSGGKPIWGRSVMSAPTIHARSIAVTPAGDVVIGGSFWTGPSYVTEDGFVITLDGDDGATRWSKVLGAPGVDVVAGVAAGADAANVTAIYVYGVLGEDTVIDGQTFSAGGYLLRYDESGTRRWVQSFQWMGADGQSLALDPQRGPVIAGGFYGDLTLGDQVLTAEYDGNWWSDAVVAGFDPDGRLRFARQIFTDSVAWSYNVAIAPSGDIYVASDTWGAESVVDDHLIPFFDDIDHPFLLRLTPEGRYASSTVIRGRGSAWPYHVATDAAGASYLLGDCSGQIGVQPEITCADESSLIVSYDANNEYRWATYVTPAQLDAIAPAPGNRLIVAGRALSPTIDFGGVHLPTQQLVIAALAGGPARLPSPLPAAPAISSVTIDGISDRELRQGGTGTLVILGTGLDRVTKARLGDFDVHVPAGAGTAGELRLPVTIPHGHAPGWVGLTLGNAGGSTQTANAVLVTPVVVSPLGSDSGRGTFTSPLRLCTYGLNQQLRYGDVLLLRNGIHTCDRYIDVPRGVSVRGESKAGVILRVGSDAAYALSGFLAMPGSFGTTVFERMTIESVDDSNSAFTGPGRGVQFAVTDVDIRGVSGNGIWLYYGAVATVTRFRYQQGGGTAFLIDDAHLDASEVEVSDAYQGVQMLAGTLNLADSSLSSQRPAVEVGSIDHWYGTSDVTIARTTLGSGLAMTGARVTVTDSTIAPTSGSPTSFGVHQQGGALTLTNSLVRGFPDDCIRTAPLYNSAPDYDLWRVAHLTLDQVELACGQGVSYDTRGGGHFSLRRSHVQASAGAAVTIGGKFTAVDLGTTTSPGDNQLESAAGSPALWDDRHEAGAAVNAHGTTLNGMSFKGDVLGPVDVSGAYRIDGPNTIRF
jgi:hypothetical protein